MSTATISIGVEPAIKRAAVSGFVNRQVKEPEGEYRRPNAVTLRAIREAEQGIGLTRYERLEDLYREIGWEGW